MGALDSNLNTAAETAGTVPAHPGGVVPSGAYLPSDHWVMLVGEWSGSVEPPTVDDLADVVRAVPGVEVTTTTDPLGSITWGHVVVGALAAGVAGALVGLDTSSRMERVRIVSVRALHRRSVAAGAVLGVAHSLSPSNAVVFDPDSDSWDLVSGGSKAVDEVTEPRNWFPVVIGLAALAIGVAFALQGRR